MSNDSTPARQPKLKIAMSWAVAALGVLIGIVALSRFGDSSLPIGEHFEGWYLRWVDLASTGLLAIGLLVGSLTAPRRPKLAGVVFLAFLPVTAFCMSYPDSNFSVWDADGSWWFEFPQPLTAIGLALLFFAPFAALFAMFRRRKRAAIVFALLVLAAISVFAVSRWTSIFLPRLAGFSLPFLLFGLFWFATHYLHWPVLIQSPRGLVRRLASVAITVFAILVVAVGVTTAHEVYYSSLWNGDCRAPAPVTWAKRNDNDAAFTARIVYVGLTVRTRLEMRGNPKALRDSRVGEWAIGIVQERFWGISSRWPRLVLLTNDIYWKGAEYFVDGYRTHPIFSAVPVVMGGIGCTRTKAVQDAAVDLHLLRRPPPNGAAIVGYVRRPGTYYSMVPPPDAPEVLVGARIDLSGPAGTTTATTDETGVYQFDGLAAGEYTVRLRVPDGQVVGLLRANGSRPDESVVKIKLKKDELSERNFHLDWDRKDLKGQH